MAALFGREAVEDLELRLAAGEDGEAVDRAVEGLGLTFQLSTRLTSWVAVSEEPTVDPTRPIRRELVPQELPHGLSVEGLGLRRASITLGAMPVNAAMMPPSPAMAKLSRSRRSVSPSAGPPAEKDDALRNVHPANTLLEEPVSLRERRLEAHLRDAGDGRLVVEAEVGGEGFAWDPPQRVLVRLADGSEEEVEVDVGATTSAGEVASGQAIRLVIRTTAAARASRLPAALVPERIVEVRMVLPALLLVLVVKA